MNTFIIKLCLGALQVCAPHTACSGEAELVGEHSGEKRQFSVSADCQQCNGKCSSFSPPSTHRCTAVLAGMSTSWEYFCLDGEVERKREERSVSPQNELHKNVHAAHTPGACTTNMDLTQLSKDISVEGRYKGQILPFLVFIRLF